MFSFSVLKVTMVKKAANNYACITNLKHQISMLYSDPVPLTTHPAKLPNTSVVTFLDKAYVLFKGLLTLPKPIQNKIPPIKSPFVLLVLLDQIYGYGYLITSIYLPDGFTMH